ncbi:uncharacterized protein LOC144161480 isoform X1 [Haemaphysalis longicornis]
MYLWICPSAVTSPSYQRPLCVEILRWKRSRPRDWQGWLPLEKGMLLNTEGTACPLTHRKPCRHELQGFTQVCSSAQGHRASTAGMVISIGVVARGPVWKYIVWVVLPERR